METIHCDCESCIQNDRGDWWCIRFGDFTDEENVEFCKTLDNGKVSESRRHIHG